VGNHGVGHRDLLGVGPQRAKAGAISNPREKALVFFKKAKVFWFFFSKKNCFLAVTEAALRA
jgi:hypothetical protein